MDNQIGNGVNRKDRRARSRRLKIQAGWLAAAMILACLTAACPGWAADENWNRQAELLLGMGRYPEAADMFTRAIDKEGLKAEFLLGRGLARLYAGELELAEEDLTRAIEMAPGDPAAYTALGTARFQQGSYGAAIEDYSRALAADQNFAPAYNQLAWLLATTPDENLRNAERALEMAQKAVDLDPNRHHQDTLAAALAAAGKYTQAVVMQKEVLRSAIQADQTAELEAYTARLKRYEDGKPWRMDAPEKAVEPEEADETKETEGTEEPQAEEAPSSLAAKTTPPAPPVLPTEPPTPPAPGVPQAEPQVFPGDTPPEPEAQPRPAVPAESPAPAGPAVEVVKPAPPPEPAAVALAGRETPAITVKRTPAVAPPPERPPILPAKPRPYTIQVSSYPDLQRSHSIARDLRTKGDAAFTAPTVVPGKGLQYRIFIGYYGQISEARAAAEQLKKRNFRRTDIVIKPYAIQVSRSDSPLELDHLESGLDRQGYLAYRLADPDQPRMIRLLVGAYGTEPEALPTLKALRAKGYKPEIVAR